MKSTPISTPIMDVVRAIIAIDKPTASPNSPEARPLFQKLERLLDDPQGDDLDTARATVTTELAKPTSAAPALPAVPVS